MNFNWGGPFKFLRVVGLGRQCIYIYNMYIFISRYLYTFKWAAGLTWFNMATKVKFKNNRFPYFPFPQPPARKKKQIQKKSTKKHTKQEILGNSYVFFFDPKSLDRIHGQKGWPSSSWIASNWPSVLSSIGMPPMRYYTRPWWLSKMRLESHTLENMVNMSPNGGERQQLENLRFHWCMKNTYPKWCHLQKNQTILVSICWNIS